MRMNDGAPGCCHWKRLVQLCDARAGGVEVTTAVINYVITRVVRVVCVVPVVLFVAVVSVVLAQIVYPQDA